MDVIRLRTMTEKSVFSGGKYDFENISFVDSVLDEVGITADLRIKKPSSDTIKLKVYDERRFSNSVDEVKKRLLNDETITKRDCDDGLINAIAVKIVKSRRKKDFYKNVFDKSNIVTDRIKARRQNKKSILMHKNRTNI